MQPPDRRVTLAVAAYTLAVPLMALLTILGQDGAGGGDELALVGPSVPRGIAAAMPRGSARGTSV